MRIEILIFEGCPNRAAACERVRTALDEEQAVASIEEIDVTTPDAAESLHFLGSPSVRIDGLDIEPGADDRAEFGLMCRTYRESGRLDGAPSVLMIRAAIRRHLG